MEINKVIKGFTVQRASAISQSEALSLLSPRIISHWSQIQEPVNNAVEDFLLFFTTALPFEHKKKLHDLFLKDITKDGIYVDIETFVGEMMLYHEVLAEAIYWNLNDFFTYMDSVHRKDLSKRNAPVKTL